MSSGHRKLCGGSIRRAQRKASPRSHGVAAHEARTPHSAHEPFRHGQVALHLAWLHGLKQQLALSLPNTQTSVPQLLSTPRTWWSRGASTGFVAIAMALVVSRRLGAPPPRVFGFGACHRCAKYYQCDGPEYEADAQDIEHPFAQEHFIRQSWHTQGVIRNIEDKCNP